MTSRDRPTPMTLGNMRQNNVSAVIATCLACRQRADVQVDVMADSVFVPEVGRRMVCSACGGRQRETRPAWQTMRNYPRVNSLGDFSPEGACGFGVDLIQESDESR